MRTIGAISFAVLLQFGTACTNERSLPPLPRIDTSAFQPAVRDAINQALRDAESKPGSADAAGRLGMVLHAHDQLGAAVACYRRATALDPKRSDYFYYSGAALSADGKYSEAVEPLERAVALDPTAIAIRLKLADALLESGDRKRARQVYEKIVEQNPAIAAAHFGLGKTQSGEQAIAEFTKALQVFPPYGAAQFALAAEYRKGGRMADAERTLAGYEKNRKTTPPVDDPLLASVFALNAGATGMLRQAQALEREGRLEEATAACERAVQQYPKFEQGWINLISLYGRLGRTDKIEEAYHRAISLAPNSSEAYYNYGVFCFQSGRFDDARGAFEKSTDLDARNADAWNNLGSVIERTGALDRAADAYRNAISARPEFRLAHFHLGRIYANQGRYDAAISELEKSLDPKDEQMPTYLYALAAAHARAGHKQQSVELLGKAREQAAGRGQGAIVASIDRDLKALGVAR